MFLSYQKNFVGTQKRVRMSHDIHAIGVRAVEVIVMIIIIIITIIIIIISSPGEKLQFSQCCRFLSDVRPSVSFSHFQHLLPNL